MATSRIDGWQMPADGTGEHSGIKISALKNEFNSTYPAHGSPGKPNFTNGGYSMMNGRVGDIP
jgi:hypothetical protein